MTVIKQLHVTLQHGTPGFVNQTVGARVSGSRAVRGDVTRRRFQIQRSGTNTLCPIHLV